MQAWQAVPSVARGALTAERALPVARAALVAQVVQWGGSAGQERSLVRLVQLGRVVRGQVRRVALEPVSAALGAPSA